MNRNSLPFKWRHYADVEEMMKERGVEVGHSTVFRWVQRYAPEINKRIRQHLKMSGTSYREENPKVTLSACIVLSSAVLLKAQSG